MNPFDRILLDSILRVDADGRILSLEDNRIEFKEKVSWSDKPSQIQCVKELAALSNSGGGYFIIGIEDKTGHVIGVSEDQIIDLADVTNVLGVYFSPIVKLNATKYNLGDKLLFIIYAENIGDTPSVSLKDYDTKIKQGQVYFRYNGKSEPIKALDLISLFQKIKSTSPAEKLLQTQNKNRKRDKLPVFQWTGGGTDANNGFHCNFINVGARAKIYEVITSKESNAFVNAVCSTSRFMDKGDNWKIFGSFKSNFEYNKRTYSFRLYFRDDDDTLYYQEFRGGQGKMETNLVEPIEETFAELDSFKLLQAN